MKNIPDGSVDLVLTDPPYGTTACKWDSVIPFEPMWEQLSRIIKPNGAICLFGSEPFSSALRMSNIKNYKYDWIWQKSNVMGFLNAKKRPLKEIENISVFNSKVYYPQGLEINEKGKNRRGKQTETLGKYEPINKSEYKNYPRTILQFKSERGFHPTQKPVALFEYLIRTYTNEDETVLDFTMGSGSTGVACVNTNRKFIGIELDEGYFNIAKKRIEEAYAD
jgi:site-specific DNA-methyltransferase (adenine-specific)